MNNVTILKDRDGEYRVPAPDGTEAGAYYTDDRDDAIDTCRMIYLRAGIPHVTIKLRTVASHS